MPPSRVDASATAASGGKDPLFGGPATYSRRSGSPGSRSAAKGQAPRLSVLVIPLVSQQDGAALGGQMDAAVQRWQGKVTGKRTSVGCPASPRMGGLASTQSFRMPIYLINPWKSSQPLGASYACCKATTPRRPFLLHVRDTYLSTEVGIYSSMPDHRPGKCYIVSYRYFVLWCQVSIPRREPSAPDLWDALGSGQGANGLRNCTFGSHGSQQANYAPPDVSQAS